jgi:hypothetical protein
MSHELHTFVTTLLSPTAEVHLDKVTVEPMAEAAALVLRRHGRGGTSPLGSDWGHSGGEISREWLEGRQVGVCSYEARRPTWKSQFTQLRSRFGLTDGARARSHGAGRQWAAPQTDSRRCGRQRHNHNTASGSGPAADGSRIADRDGQDGGNTWRPIYNIFAGIPHSIIAIPFLPA